MNGEAESEALNHGKGGEEEGLKMTVCRDRIAKDRDAGVVSYWDSKKGGLGENTQWNFDVEE